MGRPGFDVLGVCNDMLDEVNLIVCKQTVGLPCKFTLLDRRPCIRMYTCLSLSMGMGARAQVVGVCGKAGSHEGGSSFDIPFPRCDEIP